MRKKVRRFWATWNFEKEELWLNQMAQEGWALNSVGFCTYEFEPCEPGEYLFKIELLKNHLETTESKQYIQFIEETGVEQVGNYIRWVYFRKKAVDGPFNLFSDYESKINHLKRIVRLMLPVGFINIGIGLSNLNIGSNLDSSPNGYIGFINLFLGFVLLYGSWNIKQKEKNLQQEKQIFES